MPDITTQFNNLMPHRPKVRQSGVAPSIINTQDIADNAITEAKIKSITWDKAQGGTLTLGGAGNVDGLEKVKNAAGSVVVQLDNTGITVSGGNILVKNGNAQTILDTTGIVSTANFPNGQVIDASTHTTTSTTPVTVPGSTLSSFTLSRTANVLLLVSVSGYNPDFSANGHTMQVLVNDTLQGTLLSYYMASYWKLNTIIQDGSKNITGWSTTDEPMFFTAGVLVSLSAGAHTLSLQYNVNTAITAEIDFYQLAYVILGS